MKNLVYLLILTDTAEAAWNKVHEVIVFRIHMSKNIVSPSLLINSLAMT